MLYPLFANPKHRVFAATLFGMSSAVTDRPDVLVLGGGGILGEAWMFSVLAGLGQAAGWDLRECRCFFGTSAGSIVATALAAGMTPRERLAQMGENGAGATPAAAST